MSSPATARADDSVPPRRAEGGFVCPRCRVRYDDKSRLSLCPEDASPLVRAADLADADGDPMLGRVLAGRFTILARLGAGSMGTVYRARQAPMGRDVALKILRSDRAVDEGSRARFLREARANSLLTSPNTVTVFDFGQAEEGEFFLAMELLEGESLGQRIRRLGRLDVGSALDTARQALRSLAEAHAKGIVHRDLKPDNLFYARVHTPETYEEIAKVLDFGIAKMLRSEDDAPMNVVETQAGTVFGTPRYMSPEQAQGKPLDLRSDLYSLGVILYHMLSGRPPFADDDAIVVMAHHIKTTPRPLGEVAPEARIPREVEQAVMRALAKDPALRPQSAESMAAELARARETLTPPTSGRRAAREAGRAGGLLLGGPGSARTIFIALAVAALVAGGLAWATAPRRTMDGARDRQAPSAPASPEPPGAAEPLPRAAPLAAVPGPAVGAIGNAAEPPLVEASALPRTAPRPPTARPRPIPTARAPGAPPAGSSVGYGYLE